MADQTGLETPLDDIAMHEPVEPAGDGVGAAPFAGEVVSGGASGEVVPGLGDGGLGEGLTAVVPESAGGLGAYAGAGSSGPHLPGAVDEGDGDGLVQEPVARRQGGSGRSRVAGRHGGVSEEQVAGLRLLAEGVAEAYQQRDTADSEVLGAAVAALDEALAG
ncbi:hypothetical protein ACFW9P_45465, partial [Streptomyces sp. NPDC059489]